jgi:hypothetical protein
MSGQRDVERIEPWMLPRYLEQLKEQGVAEVGWNKERLSLDESLQRAAGLTDTSTVVVDGTQLYVAEPDHSADEAPRPRSGVVPLQIWPRRTQ